MMVKNRSRYIWLLVLAGIAGVVIYFLTHKKELLNFVVPEITEITLIEADIHKDTAYIDVYAVAQNKAPYRISVDSIVCELSLGGTQLLSEKEYVGLSQAPNQVDTVKFSIKIPVKRTQNKIRSLQSQDTTGISLHASIIYSSHKINFTKNKTIEVPIPPRLRILKTVKKEVNPLKKDLKADLYLEIINDGKNLDLSIHDLGYALQIGNDLSTQGTYGRDISIRPRSAKVLIFPLDFRMENPVSTILKVWTDNDRVPFKLKLTGFIDAGNMKRIPVVIHASGSLEIVNEDKKKAEKEAKKEAKKKR